MSRRRWHSSSAPALPLEEEDLVQEILLRLPPLPSALPRASLVCKRWRGILSDPRFIGCYRRHHRRPPLLGFMTRWEYGMRHEFVPLPRKKPDRIPPARFAAVPRSRTLHGRWRFLGYRHGLAGMLNASRREVVTGQQHHVVPFPPGLCNSEGEGLWTWHAAVLCADAEDGHAHGDCFLSPFKLVLTCGGRTGAFACLYESASGVWGNIVSTATTDAVASIKPSILIGNAVYWLIHGGDIPVFDIKRQTFGVTEKPADVHRTDFWSFQLLRTDNGCGLGLAVMSGLSIHLWERELNADGLVGWVVLQKTIPPELMFAQRMRSDHKEAVMLRYDEESNVVVLAMFIGDFILRLESMQFRRISERNGWDNTIHYAYKNFYTAGRGVGWKWLDLKL